MKQIEINHYTYLGYDIYLAVHPKLIGKYEIYKGENFIKRGYSLKDCKQIIKSNSWKNQTYN